MQLIDKDALMVEIERLRKEDGNPYFPSETSDKYYARGVHFTCDGLVNFLDTLKVKEVDLEKSISDWLFEGLPNDEEEIDYIKETAKHFFELGLKAQRG